MKKLITLIMLILGFTIHSYSQYSQKPQIDTIVDECSQQIKFLVKNHLYLDCQIPIVIRPQVDTYFEYKINWNSQMHYNNFINKQIFMFSYMRIRKLNPISNINNIFLDPFRWYKFYNYYIK